MSPSDAWVKAAAYESYVGRWSRMVAAQFVRWLDLPAGLDWLEIGCGTGALTGRINEIAQPGTITCMDPSLGFITLARQQAQGTFVTGSGMSLPFRSGSFDAIVSGLVLNFIPDMQRALGEMKRTCRAGGTVAAYVWDYAGGMQMMRIFWDAAGELDPTVGSRDEMRRFPICKPEPLRELFESAGLVRVETRGVDIPTTFRSFDDYWAPFLEGQGPAPGYVMSLPEAKRTELRDLLVKRLPSAPDGTIPLAARAWAVRGTIPESSA